MIKKENKNSKIRIVIFLVIILLTLAGVSILFILRANLRPCPEDIENDTAIECYGYISIDGFGENGYPYTIYDNIDSETIVEIKKWKHFKYVNRKIYAIGMAGGLPSEEFVPIGYNDYSYSFFSETGRKVFRSGSRDGLPKYFVIDTKTRYVNPYMNLEDIPETEREIFKELEE